MPEADSNEWNQLGQASRDALRESVAAAVAGDAQTAADRATAAAYSVCSEGDLLRWSPLATGHAVAILRVAGEPLHLEAPHPAYDSGTLDEAVVLFEQLQARVLLTSGTHRCASSEATECSGTSSVCTGLTEAYRNSDAAHAVDTSFHVLHEALTIGFPDDLVVSVHGMSGAGASLSNGTDDTITPSSPVARLAGALAVEFGGELITTCNDYPGSTVDSRLCGTTNVQGRHLNGSADACGSAADSASERFVHLEQSRDLRDAPIRVAAALAVLLQ